ncbi:MAG: PAS domain S-box protein [Chitinivibrionales bacterium]|nr:PAS domain S-box protein [Chitinivibrionales bacterium]
MLNTALLFVSNRNSLRSQIAEGFARTMAPSGVEVLSAGLDPLPVNPIAVEVMSETGIDISGHEAKAISSLKSKRIDIVILLCDDPGRECMVLPGCPAVIQWKIDDVFTANPGNNELREACRVVAAHIHQRVKNFFNDGYFSSLIHQRSSMNTMLDSLNEGVMAHDMDRKIFYFSRGAEKITGYSQLDVLGKDCHEVFSPRLCGEECSFCDGYDPSTVKNKEYSTVFLTIDGRRREFDVTVSPMKNDGDMPIGVVAALNDQTKLRTLEHQTGTVPGFRGIIGLDYKILAIFDLIQDLAQCDFPVVITGESGTGKELVARAIHAESPRRDKHFVPVNCGALPEGTLESELFGHVKGAFTGAIRDKKGRFELADGGTLFLDEVAELSQAMQVKLLRVLQEGTFEPVGSEKTLKVNVRIISATNRDIRQMVKKGEFREDLFYRLAVVPVEMPPLRDHRNDIPIMAHHFLKESAGKLGKSDYALSDDTLSVMMSYSWPGNVRQLQNAIQFSLIKCHTPIIDPEHLPPEINRSMEFHVESSRNTDTQGSGKAGRKPKLSPPNVETVLKRVAGNKAKAARMLGVGRATLYNFLKDYPHLGEIGEES